MKGAGRIRTIPLSSPLINGNEWAYVKSCLDSGWVSSAGSFVTQFEEKICEFTKAKFAVATNCGTAALHLALIINGLTPNDEVLVPTITFIAPINAVKYCGATPIFIDCDHFYNINIEKIKLFLERNTELRNNSVFNRRTGKRIWGVLPVHVHGNPVNMPQLLQVTKEVGLKVVEDATESLGSYVGSKHTGTFGDVGCLSFNGNKIITTGGGGMLITDDEQLALHARRLSTQSKIDSIQFIHNEVGFNYRLSNISAAIGVAQLEQLESIITKKSSIYQLYRELLKNSSDSSLSTPPEYGRANYWQIPFRLHRSQGIDQTVRLINKLASDRIESRPLWTPNHLQAPFSECETFELELAGKMHRETIILPSSATITNEEVREVAETLNSLELAGSF